MKMKIDFEKLLCGDYWLEIELEMINWFFATGLKGRDKWHEGYDRTDYEVQSGWYRAGINQLLYGYSACNENNRADFFPIEHSEDMKDFITVVFVRAIVSPESYYSCGKAKVAEWREVNKIGLGKYRIFKFPEPSGKVKNRDVGSLLWQISDFKNKEMKKKFAHPDYPNRTRPRIKYVKFSTYGEGYFIEIAFNFWEDNYQFGGSWWTEKIAQQKKGEHLQDFLARALRKLKAITINTERNSRLHYETEKHFVTFSERCCANCIHLEKKGDKEICGYMADFGKVKPFGKNNAIDNPNDHLCDEWDYEEDD